MIQVIQIGFSVVAIVAAFFSRVWPWIVLAVPLVWFSFTAIAIKLEPKPRYMDELSPAANRLFQRWFRFYTMPFAGSDFGAASSIMGLAAIIVAFFGCFHGFYFGITFGFFFFSLSIVLARIFNPTSFLTDPIDKLAHAEVCEFMNRRREEAREQTRNPDPVPEPVSESNYPDNSVGIMPSFEGDYPSDETAIPLLTDGLYDLEVFEMYTGKNAMKNGYDLNIKLGLTKQAVAQNGTTLNPGFPLFDLVPLVKTETYDPRPKLGEFMEAAKGSKSGSFNPLEQWIGCKVMAHVVIENSEEFGVKNRIKQYFKPD